jgi:hypothetical protein
MTYTTFNGTKKEFEDIDHQHISNIYWYNRIVREHTEHELHTIIVKIKDKFGNTLPYRPHPDFTIEIEALQEMRCLRWSDDKMSADIYFEGRKVGEFHTKEYIRDAKIQTLLS